MSGHDLDDDLDDPATAQADRIEALLDRVGEDTSTMCQPIYEQGSLGLFFPERYQPCGKPAHQPPIFRQRRDGVWVCAFCHPYPPGRAAR